MSAISIDFQEFTVSLTELQEEVGRRGKQREYLWFFFDAQNNLIMKSLTRFRWCAQQRAWERAFNTCWTETGRGMVFKKEIRVQLPEKEREAGQAKNNRCLWQMVSFTSVFAHHAIISLLMLLPSWASFWLIHCFVVFFKHKEINYILSYWCP